MNFSFVFVTSTWPRWRERFPATGPTEPGSSDRGWGGKASGPPWVDQEKPRLADELGLTDGWMNETHCMSQHPVSCPTIWFLRMYPRHVLRGLNGTECSSFSDMETINCIKRRVERLGYCTMLPFFSSLLPAFAARHRPGYSTGCCWRPRHFILFGEKKTFDVFWTELTISKHFHAWQKDWQMSILAAPVTCGHVSSSPGTSHHSKLGWVKLISVWSAHVEQFDLKRIKPVLAFSQSHLTACFSSLLIFSGF